MRSRSGLSGNRGAGVVFEKNIIIDQCRAEGGGLLLVGKRRHGKQGQSDRTEKQNGDPV
jgi:hypothetical protein